MPEDVNVSKGTIATVGLVLAILAAGASGGVQLYSMREALAQSTATMTAQDARLAKVEQVTGQLDALMKVKCFEAGDIEDSAKRARAFERLALSNIDCRPVVPSALAPAATP